MSAQLRSAFAVSERCCRCWTVGALSARSSITVRRLLESISRSNL